MAQIYEITGSFSTLSAESGQQLPTAYETIGSVKIATSLWIHTMSDEEPLSAVVPWAQRDRRLEIKVRELYKTHLSSWIAAQGDRKFERQWHVGRALLDWFYEQNLISPDEFEELNTLHSRPSKPGYDIEMYRLIWIGSGRASDEVAAMSLAPRTGPSSGYARQSGGVPSISSDLTAVPGQILTRLATVRRTALRADEELVYGSGGWIYAYGFEEALKFSDLLGQEPLLKIGHTGGHYADRVAAQVRGTEVPDAAHILRAYQVHESASFEAELHRRLKATGCHHRRAGGAEWFRVTAQVLDSVVEDVAGWIATRST